MRGITVGLSAVALVGFLLACSKDSSAPTTPASNRTVIGALLGTWDLRIIKATRGYCQQSGTVTTCLTNSPDLLMIGGTVVLSGPVDSTSWDLSQGGLTRLRAHYELRLQHWQEDNYSPCVYSAPTVPTLIECLQRLSPIADSALTGDSVFVVNEEGGGSAILELRGAVAYAWYATGYAPTVLYDSIAGGLESGSLYGPTAIVGELRKRVPQ